MLKPGWLDRQFTKVSNDVKEWPGWLKREAGLDYECETKPDKSASEGKSKDRKKEYEKKE